MGGEREEKMAVKGRRLKVRHRRKKVERPFSCISGPSL